MKRVSGGYGPAYLAAVIAFGLFIVWVITKALLP